MHLLRMAWRALRREWRSGELAVLLASLSVAVAALTGVGFLVDRIDQIGKEKLPPREQLRRCGDAYVRFGLEHPEEYWLTFMAGITPKKIKEQGGHRASNPQRGEPGTTGAIAFQHVVMPTAFTDGVLQVAVSNPFDTALLNAVQFDARGPAGAVSPLACAILRESAVLLVLRTGGPPAWRT